MGTTYYFTVCAYVTNVGNGTSYNVNAKTKGLMLYKNGTFYNGAGIITSDYSGLVWTNNGSYLYNTINTKTSGGVYYIGSSSSIDFASYSKIGINFKFLNYPNGNSSYNKFYPVMEVKQSSGYYSQATDVVYTDRQSITMNVTYTYTIPYTIISGKTASGVWRFKPYYFYQTNSSGGGNIRDAGLVYIYELWLE